MHIYVYMYFCLSIDMYFLSFVFFLFSYYFSYFCFSIWCFHEFSFLSLLHLNFFSEFATAVLVSGASFHACASLDVSFYRRAFHMFSGVLGMYNLYSMLDLYFSTSMHCQYFTKTTLLLFCTSCT